MSYRGTSNRAGVGLHLLEDCSVTWLGRPRQQQWGDLPPSETWEQLIKHRQQVKHAVARFLEMIICSRFKQHHRQGFLTGDYEVDVRGHGRPQLVKGVASVHPLKLDELLVVEYKTAICVWRFHCCGTRRDKFFAIFCPSVPDGTKCNMPRLPSFIRNQTVLF